MTRWRSHWIAILLLATARSSALVQAARQQATLTTVATTVLFPTAIAAEATAAAEAEVAVAVLLLMTMPMLMAVTVTVWKGAFTLAHLLLGMLIT